MPTPPDDATDDLLADFKRMFSGEGPEVKLAILKEWLAREWGEVAAGRTPVDRCLHLALLEYAVSWIEACAKSAHDALEETREARRKDAERIAANDRRANLHQKVMYGILIVGMIFTMVQAGAVCWQATHPQVVTTTIERGAVQVAAPPAPPAPPPAQITFSPTIYVTAKPAPKASK